MARLHALQMGWVGDLKGRLSVLGLGCNLSPPEASNWSQAELDNLHDVIDTLRRQRKQRLAEDLKEQQRAEQQRKEDMEWLQRKWERALDAQMEEDKRDYEVCGTSRDRVLTILS